MSRSGRFDWLLSQRVGRLRNRKRPTGPHRRSLRFEPLEDRRLLSISVDTLVDEADGIGVGAGTSLRDAIVAAMPGDDIVFDPALTAGGPATITLTLGELAIDKSLAITGPGAELLTIRAFDPTPLQNNGDGSRVFYVNDAVGTADVFISGLTITGGDPLGIAGAILSRSGDRLTLTGTTITGNSSGNFDGGAIYSDGGELHINASVITGNTGSRGGGIYHANGPLTILNSAVGDNSAFRGGGISLRAATAEITNSEISGNLVTFTGGGLYNNEGDVTVTNSVIRDNRAGGDGGGVYSRSGELTVIASSISGNSADADATGSGDGGGIATTQQNVTINASTISGNSGTDGGGIHIRGDYYGNPLITITGSTISGNIATWHGGGVFAVGYGGKYANPTLIQIRDSSITGNMADADRNDFGSGGGIFGQYVALDLSASTISGNTARSGGGVYSGYGDATITDSLIHQNEATTGSGGGIYFYGGYYGNVFTITNSTISGNSADGSGGGVFAFGNGSEYAGPTMIRVRYSTITGNTAGSGVGFSDSGGGMYVAQYGTVVELDHTIVAGNTDQSLVAPDLDATTAPPESLVVRYSLVGDNAASGLTEAPLGMPDSDGNLIGDEAGDGIIDPLLAPLADNGGPTMTHALLLGSPAIDAGDPDAEAGVGTVPDFDQRGTPFSRVFDGDSDSDAIIDIGAFENHANYFLVDTIDDESDGDYSAGDLSLREAIDSSNVSATVDTILFSSDLDGQTISLLLAVGALTITDSVTIDARALASGITIDASGFDNTPGIPDGQGDRVFDLNDGGTGHLDVFFLNLTITGGDGGGNGGGVYSLENLTLVDSTVAGNAGFNGGGVYSAFGILTVIRSSISGNTALNAGGGGGGVLIFDGDATILSSTLSGNQASYGGALYLAGMALAHTTRITNSTISGNDAVVAGGAIYNFGGVAVVEFTTITDNDSPDFAGSGIAAQHPSFARTELYSSIVAGNSHTDLALTAAINSYVSHGYNIVGTLGDGVDTFVEVGDQVDVVDPKLGPLADNGGPTMTHALLFGSPAVDAGDPTAEAGIGGVPEFDERGEPFARIRDGDVQESIAIDIGAFEVQLPLPALLGDYNLNGGVDAADFSVWRDTLGQSGLVSYSGADGNGNGMIDFGDYQVWKDNFGNTLPPEGAGAGSGAAAISALAEPVAPASQPPALPGISAATTAVAADRPAEVDAPPPAIIDGRAINPPAKPGAPKPIAKLSGVTTHRDDALLAWLSSRTRANRSAGEPTSRPTTQVEQPSESPDSTLEAIDSLFDLLADRRDGV